MERKVLSIHSNAANTHKLLSDRLAQLHRLTGGAGDYGFPVLRSDKHTHDNVLLGYIEGTELGRALNQMPPESEAEIHFCNAPSWDEPSTESLAADRLAHEMHDFSLFMNLVSAVLSLVYEPWILIVSSQDPIRVTRRTSLVVVHEIFSKLGVKEILVMDGHRFEGIIFKKAWLAFLQQLEGDDH